MQGSRIINLDNLQEYINRLTVHAAQCEGNIVLTGETRAGLASIISSHCSKCSYTVSLETSHRVKGPKGTHWWEHNLAAVWGQLVVVIHVFRRQWVYLEFLSCQKKTSSIPRGTLVSGGESSCKKWWWWLARRRNIWQKREVTFMRGSQPSLLQWMEGGVSAHTATPTMLIQG